MANPLAGVAKSIAAALGPLFTAATIVRETARRNPTDAFDPAAPVKENYPCMAMVQNYSARYRQDALVPMSDRKVLVLSHGLGIKPKPGDRLLIGGMSFLAIEVTVDPANAVWEIQGRRE